MIKFEEFLIQIKEKCNRQIREFVTLVSVLFTKGKVIKVTLESTKKALQVKIKYLIIKIEKN